MIVHGSGHAAMATIGGGHTAAVVIGGGGVVAGRATHECPRCGHNAGHRVRSGIEGGAVGIPGWWGGSTAREGRAGGGGTGVYETSVMEGQGGRLV